MTKALRKQRKWNEDVAGVEEILYNLVMIDLGTGIIQSRFDSGIH